jgi:hypothetical protein
MIEIIDLLFWHEFVDFNNGKARSSSYSSLSSRRISNRDRLDIVPSGLLTFERDRFELVVCYLDVFALADLVGFDDVVIVNRFAGPSIDLQVTSAMAGPLIDQVESDLVALCRRGIERNWALHQ